MNHSVRTMMEISFASLLFLMAATTGLLLFQSGMASLHTTYVSGQTQDRNVKSTLSPIAGDSSVSGAELLQILASFGEDRVDVVVDGTLYPQSLERDQLNATHISLNGSYTPSYERDTRGHLLRMVFVSRGGTG